MNNARDLIREKLALLPGSPGVYLMKNKEGTIIYVGKASVLKNRVRSYFHSGGTVSPRVQALVTKIADFEYIVTSNELEALILECNLIKKHRPRYNVLLKDDKSYPYIKITLAEDYPRVIPTRRLLSDGSRYFGPYADVGAMRRTLEILRKVFPLRVCRKMGARPCLEFHIKRCLAPCAGGVDKETYARLAAGAGVFLEGKSSLLLKELKKNMGKAADALRYEEAAALRDQIKALEESLKQQTAVTLTGDLDVIALARENTDICAQVFFVRAGKISGRDHFLLTAGEFSGEEEILAAFLQQYYARAAFVPKELVLPRALPPAEIKVLSAWLGGRAGRAVALTFPRRGVKKDLLALAEENARVLVKEEAARRSGAVRSQKEALAGLAAALNLPVPPERMDCFDISHIQGAETVASMVVFKAGAPSRGDYRRYKIRTTEGRPDDFQAMREVLARRYGKYECLPQLTVIDGGRGQLSAALEVIRGLGLDMPVIGLAKRLEEIYREDEPKPRQLPDNSPAILLLRRLRDEAHRFAVTYHRKLRGRRNLASVLDNIPGIGKARRQSLWKHFGSLQAIKEASAEELAKAAGMNRRAAAAVKNFFALRGGEYE
jgi:excinuclease ABC subunit C